MSESKDDIRSGIINTNRLKRNLEKSTEMKKYQQIEEIKSMGEEIKNNPSKVEIVHVPWYKKVMRTIRRGFISFFTKLK